MTLELIAPAKLNLTLEVLGKREDGYHEVISLMQAIDLCDRITLAEAPAFELRLDGDITGVPSGESNLVYRAVSALQAATGAARCAHQHHEAHTGRLRHGRRQHRRRRRAPRPQSASPAAT